MTSKQTNKQASMGTTDVRSAGRDDPEGRSSDRLHTHRRFRDMKTVTATIGVLACTIYGCTGSVIELGDSPFEPGIYSGLSTCNSTTSINGVVTEEVMTTEELTVTISESGLPTYEAKEVALEHSQSFRSVYPQCS